MSLESSRENSSTDLVGKTKDRKKNVHFNKTRDESMEDVKVNTIEPLELPPLSDDNIASTDQSVRPSTSGWPAKSSLFFLEEGEDDATDVPITPFKKTGKIKTTPHGKPLADHRPGDSSPGYSIDSPFVSHDADLTIPPRATRIADRRNKQFDIPLIQLPAPDSRMNTPRTSMDANITLMSRAGSTPGTPAEGMIGNFAHSSTASLNDLADNQALISARLDQRFNDSTEKSAMDAAGQEPSEEHRRLNLEAYKLVRAHTIQHEQEKRPASGDNSRRSSFVSTNHSESDMILQDQLEHLGPDMTSKKGSTRGGVLSNLMQLYSSTVYQQPPVHKHHISGSASGTSTPKWHQRNSQSNASLVALLGAGHSLSGGIAGLGAHSRNSSAISLVEMDKSERPALAKMRKHSGNLVGAVKQSFNKPRIDTELRITLAIADVLQRQKFIIKLCRSLMLYGAPTHRLEDYLKLTARALELDAQFLYIPGCMIVAFDDKTTHTSDVKIVRVTQGTDLGKLNAVHLIYKNVLHEVINVEQGILDLDEQLEMPQLYKKGFVLCAYGLASVCVGPFAFGSSFLDLPIQFLLGFIVGTLQLVVAPRSQLYANVFEILATICVSFLGRGFGSIPRRHGDGTVFCFAALTQSAVCLILPGYLVLCGALELQSKSIVAGSVRLFYAIVYSLFLSFGITIGSVLYGWMDSSATQATTCTSDISDWYRFLFVPGFATCLLVVNQARPKQAPVALFIASAGYATNYFTTKRFGVAQVSNAIAAFVIGCLGNLYSRIGHGLAFTAVLPSIFVQVPSGLASGSSLVSGLELANSILNNTANSTGSTAATTTVSGSSALQFGYDMVQIAIGITVGLFASALVIYIPLCGLGKRTGMLTF